MKDNTLHNRRYIKEIVVAFIIRSPVVHGETYTTVDKPKSTKDNRTQKEQLSPTKKMNEHFLKDGVMAYNLLLMVHSCVQTGRKRISEVKLSACDVE